MTVYLDDGDVRLYHGDALQTLRELPAGSVDMVATSPPFYGLRDYGTDGQIGLEDTPDQWVDNLVAVFRECRRVLADHGTLWVEIGDSYTSTAWNGSVHGTGGATEKQATNAGSFHALRSTPGTKPKDLLGQPWLLAFALRADGWYLRSEIIWARPNPMPESVTDRPTKSHSTIFLLSKQPRYFYDADAIREAWADHRNGNPGPAKTKYTDELASGIRRYDHDTQPQTSGANARSVWTIPTQPTPFAHFATWPQKLVARMIQAGTSEHGCCPECGKPWVRDVETEHVPRTTGGGSPSHTDLKGYSPSSALVTNALPITRTLGWSPSCAHGQEPVPATVLDVFAGSGTTLLVARHHGRHAIGIELNADYCHIAATRLQQLSLLT